MTTFPSQFAGWLAVADRDGLGGASAEPPAIQRGERHDLALLLPLDDDFGDWTAGTFSARLRAAPGAAGDPLAEYTCTTGTPASGVTAISMVLEPEDQGDLPATPVATGLGEVFLQISYTIGGDEKTLVSTRVLIAEGI